MATGTINVEGVQTFTPQIKTGFTLRSWGSVSGTKIGNIVIVSANGLYSGSAVSSNTAMLSIPYSSKGNVVISFAKDTAGVASIYENESIIYGNSIEANKNMYFQIIIVV